MELTGSARSLWIVVGRELRESARRKGLWIAAAAVLVGSAALMVVPEVLGGDGERTIATAGTVPRGFPPALTDAAGTGGLDARTTPAADRAAVDSAVRDGDADIGVDFTTTPPTVVVRTASGDPLAGIVRQVVARSMLGEELEAQGLSPDQVGAALAGAQPSVAELEAERGGRSAVAFVASLVLYLLLLLLTTSVASGIAIEKSKRISEVLLAIVRPATLLYGKIIGVGLIGVLTMLAGALPIVVKLLLGGDLPPGTGTTLAASTAWFLLGIALYLTAAGGLGALVDRQEQVGSVVAPLSIILVAAYLAGVSAAGSSAGAALAIIPFTSPMVMPARLALGEAGPAEIVASLAALVLTVAVVARLTTAVYQRAIVRTGRRLHLRDVMRPS